MQSQTKEANRIVMYLFWESNIISIECYFIFQDVLLVIESRLEEISLQQ